MNKRRSGYLGECSLDYYLSFLKDQDYRILHGLRLLNEKQKYFQIDTLILTTTVLLPIEIKNYSGTITFDHQFQQLIQTKGGVEKAYEDPLLQIDRHQTQLKNWLTTNKFPGFPIVPLVVISNPSTIIKLIGNFKEYKSIIRSGNTVIKIEEIERHY